MRILFLHPSIHPDAQLEADLVHVDRADLINGNDTTSYYDAVSYCWGDAIFSHGLVCDRTSKIRITNNVDAMLRQFRKTSKYRCLWIDAICLNQQDLEEKDIQVPLMGNIYRQATKVLVWLGPAIQSEDVSLAFSALKAEAIKSKNLKIQTAGSKSNDSPHHLSRELEIPLIRLLYRSWFQRRWILQEIASGKHITVHCGAFKLNWNWFLDGISALVCLDSLARDTVLHRNLSRVSRTMLAACASTEQSRLVDLLWNFRTSLCSMPQDRIYAILGMAKDAQELDSVDYRLHWSEVYTSAATVLFPNNAVTMFEHLVAFGSLSQKYPACPSWVPNWNSPEIYSYLFERVEARDKIWDFPKRRTTFVHDRLLTFQTTYAAEATCLGDIGHGWLARLQSQFAHNSPDEWDTNHIFGIVFVASMGLNQNLSKSIQALVISSTKDPLVDSVKRALKRVCEDAPIPQIDIKEVVSEAVSKAIECIAQNRVPFISCATKKHDSPIFGIGPADTRNGDILIALPGNRTRYLHKQKEASLGLLIRPVDGVVTHRKSVGRCQLVGVCVYAFLSVPDRARDLDMGLKVELA
jgi:hypothetical protein